MNRLRLLAWVYVTLCSSLLAVGAVVCVGLILSTDPASSNALLYVGPAFIALAALYLIPGLAGGLGLLYRKKWARVVIVILSLPGIFLFPVGTALSVFGLWVLLGRDRSQLGSPIKQRTQAPSWTSRQARLFLVMAGVAALFVVVIGTGFRITHSSAPPLIHDAYWGAIALLIVVIALAVRASSLQRWHPALPGGMWYGGRRDDLARRRMDVEEALRRRLEALAADPDRRKYADRIRRGESWSDEQIDYAENPAAVATCEHLRPIERAMRIAGIDVRLNLGPKVSAIARIDHDSFREQFLLPEVVKYSEPPAHGRGFEDVREALIACEQHRSAIDVVHPQEAKPSTPWFPRRPESSAESRADALTRLAERVEQLGRIIDAPDWRLPTFGCSEQSGRPHIEIDGVTFHYVMEDRGVEYQRDRTTSEDELLYWVFRHVTFHVAATHLGVSQLNPINRRQILRHQLMLLGRLDPAWEKRKAAE